MSQWLGKILDGVNLPVHPHTGMSAIGVLPSGRIVWPIMGAAEDDEDKDGDTDAGGSGEEKDDDQDGGSSGGGPDKKDTTGATVAAEELEKLRARMQAADRRASAAEQELRKLTDKDKSELEKAQRDLQESQDKIKSLEPLVREQAIRIAFLSAGAGVTWHDPEDALSFAMKELKDVEVSEDGTVDRDRVKKVVQKIAKEKHYLVKKQDTTNDDSGGDGGKDDGKPPSGDRMNGGKDKDRTKLDREKLAEKYPALRR